MPGVLQGLAMEVHGEFVAALSALLPHAKVDDGSGGDEMKCQDTAFNVNHDWSSRCTLFKTAAGTAVKMAPRMQVKIAAYRKHKPETGFPFAALLADPLRTTIVCDTAEAMVMTYEALSAEGSPFKITRLKHKLNAKTAPFNLHINCVFSPANNGRPLTVEIQLIPRGIMEVFTQSHKQYEIARALNAEALTPS